MKEDEKRKRRRVPFRTQVVLKIGTEVLIETTSADISMNGVLIETDKKVPLGSPCELEIVLSGKTSKLAMYVKGSVARQDVSCIGIKFDDDLEWWSIFAIYAQYGKPK